MTLACFCVLSGCAPGVGPPGAGERPPDVLVVTLDTARADHFSYRGDSPVPTPAVDSLAAEGAGFVTAIAPTPITLPSHASLFTGLSPVRHGVRNNGRYRLAAEAVTLAEIFAGAGYRTAAFVGAAVLDRRYGLDQGFQDYDDTVGAPGSAGLFQVARRRGEEVVEAALAWLDRQERHRPTFVWVHLFDAHAPYDPPEPERARFPASAYAAEIAYADRAVGRLLDGYRRAGRYDDAVIVLTADHGESLGEHGEATHGVFLYDATLRVPLVLRAPGVAAGTRVERQVRLLDLYPTIVALAGLSSPAAVDGLDLGPLLRGQAALPRDAPAYLESYLPLEQYGWSELVGVRLDGWKFVRGTAPELYDLERDPREIDDVAEEYPRRTAEMRRLAETQARQAGLVPERLEVDAATREQLAALGYIDGGGSEAASSSPRPDPRRRIAGKRRMMEAARSFARGERQKALLAYRAIVAEEPENLVALSQLGDLLALAGRFEEALEAYGRTASMLPGSADLQRNRAHCLEQLGRLAEALEALDAALAADPFYRDARNRRWDLLRRLGRAHEVESEARAALAVAGADGDAHLSLALALGETVGREAMRRALERGLARDPEHPGLGAALAGVEVSEGSVQAGVRRFRDLLRRHPTHVRAAVELARVLLYQEEVSAARQVLEARANDPLPDPELLFLLAETRAREGDVPAALPLAERAVALLPQRAEAWSTLGSVRLLAGRAAAAAEAYERALALEPADRTIELNLAMAYEQLGRLPAASALRARQAAPIDRE